MKQIHQSIENLTGSEAKSLLANIMYLLNMMKESEENQDEMIEQLYSLYDEIIGVSQNDQSLARVYETVHIVCGESAAGSLRVGLGNENKVIGFPDFFAEGPIWQLHRNSGRRHRYEWLKDHLNIVMDYMEEEYEPRLLKALEEINAISDELPIVLWTAENAAEQTGMRYIVYLLKEKRNDVFLINSTKAYQELFNTDEYKYFCLHTGEVIPEKLKAMDDKKRLYPLTVEERKRYVEEWLLLSETKEVLRIWEKGQINSVSENYFDPFIIETAQQLHAEQGQHDFMLSARIIGEVLGHLDQCKGDAFLEYRLRMLIYSGVFEIKGIPKGMPYYSVKLI